MVGNIIPLTMVKSALKAPYSTKRDTLKIDTYLLAATFLLVLIGLITVYDSSVVHAFKDFGDKYYFIKQQIIWATLGVFAFLFFSFFNYQNFKKLAPIILIISFFLLLAVFIPGLGVEVGGAHRWLKIGPFTLQPAEIMKLSSIIFFASLFEKKIKTAPFLAVTVIIFAILAGLQRDLGSSIVFILTAISMYFIGGARLDYFAYFLPLTFIGFLFFTLSSTYRKQRVLAFLDPFADPQGYTYHISQVLIALGSGSLLGLGLGQSRQKFEYIPEVSTDSIFSIIGEEFGFLGAVVLIGLLSFLVYRGLKIAEQTDDKFGKLLAFGLTTSIAVQTIINLASMVSLIPLTGVPLPFISYGGSALLANIISIGILINISKSSSR